MADLRGSEPFDGLFVVRAVMGDGPAAVVARTPDWATADLLLRQVRSFPLHRSSWVDLEDRDGNPHPCLTDGP